jgi:hypothetical protein
MAQRPMPKSAAQALYGHLPSAAREPVQQRRTANSLSEALYPHNPTAQPKPQPDNWQDVMLERMGLRRKR